jgi:hypothetical protein
VIVGKARTSKDPEVNRRRQEAGTPRGLFEQLHSECLFTVDICATAHNAKLSRYVSPREDALITAWNAEGISWLLNEPCRNKAERVWCHPPYDDIPRWLVHALEPEIAVYLLPARTDREWFRQWKPLAEVHWFVGEKPHRRLQFEPPPGCTYSSNPDSHLLMCFGPGFAAGLESWRSGRTYEIIPRFRRL